ncbi:hypothetical protein TSAR_007768 [Trichomalopsis sarcophagae]|uniref:ER lumen protein-retaining receptor n=1 Tax=Trichomalopsis sarcophagae TaxID=543379 RepID=A0A232F167_9HYME|nr:hypothetical protein TSAR_007768 [Trichomalopsis sarcophagae]
MRTASLSDARYEPRVVQCNSTHPSIRLHTHFPLHGLSSASDQRSELLDMDILQIFGDYVHLLGMIILLAKLWLTKSCAGISGKTQLLFALVFTARNADLTIRYVSLYNTILKIVCLAITYCTVLSIFLFFRKTYDRKRDAFRIELLILPCAVFALFLNKAFETIEVFWAFSVYLEALAIIPQVYLISKSKEADSVVMSYISCLGLYRGCYVLHWLYAYKNSMDIPLEQIAVASGVVQLIFYFDITVRNLPILKPKQCMNSTEVTAARDKEATVRETVTKDEVTEQVVRLPDIERDATTAIKDVKEEAAACGSASATEESVRN